MRTSRNKKKNKNFFCFVFEISRGFIGRRASPVAELHQSQSFTSRRASPVAELHQSQSFTSRNILLRRSTSNLLFPLLHTSKVAQKDNRNGSGNHSLISRDDGQPCRELRSMHLRSWRELDSCRWIHQRERDFHHILTSSSHGQELKRFCGRESLSRERQCEWRHQIQK